MSSPRVIAIEPPMGKLLLVAGGFTMCALFIAWYAYNGWTDVRTIRHLPLSQEGKVIALWALAGVSMVLPVLAVVPKLAVRSPRVLEVGADYLVVPHGLGLRHTTRLAVAQLLGARVENYGAGPVLSLSWSGGKAHLPKDWFADAAAFDDAVAAVKGLRRG